MRGDLCGCGLQPFCSVLLLTILVYLFREEGKASLTVVEQPGGEGRRGGRNGRVRPSSSVSTILVPGQFWSGNLLPGSESTEIFISVLAPEDRK